MVPVALISGEVLVERLFSKSKNSEEPKNHPLSRLPMKKEGLHCEPRSVPGSLPNGLLNCCNEGISVTARVDTGHRRTWRHPLQLALAAEAK